MPKQSECLVSVRRLGHGSHWRHVAAGHAPNGIGLVYVAAFAPDEGENPGGLFAPARAAAGRSQYYFRESFCQNLDDAEALVMALTQKPIAARCFDDKSGPPASKVKPS